MHRKSKENYFAAAKTAWELIFGNTPNSIFEDCRKGIVGAKVIGTGYLEDGIEITGLKGEFHPVEMPNGKTPGFFIKRMRVRNGNGKWILAEGILQSCRLPNIYTNIH